MALVLEAIRQLFNNFPVVKLAYLFGSQVKGNTGPLSDYDFALYLDEKRKKQRFNKRLELMGELSKLLGTDKIDVLILNDTESPELKYQIITEGKLIHEKEPFKVLIEPNILNEYFDFYATLKKYGLTKA